MPATRRRPVPRDIEAKRQVILVAVEQGAAQLREYVKNWDDNRIADLYAAMDYFGSAQTQITLKMPTGKELV